MPSKEDRKLLAIMYADVQGYSKMMGEDDVSTVRSLTRTRKVFADHVAGAGGRVVNAPGDSVLAEFPSVVEAVACALDIQKTIGIQNRRLPRPEQMIYRIGINLGDVIRKNDELFGDGVNIAARVEALTPAGGVCITRPVYDQVKTVLSAFEYRYAGRHSVKNIREPVWVYEVLRPSENGYSSRQGSDPGSRQGPGSLTGMPQGTRIAVLPFENFSGERQTDYFASGFVEDLIVDLAHFKPLQIISSYTSRKLGGQGLDELSRARELDIDFLLKGALIRKKKEIRITTQLIDTESGRLLWAEKYDAPSEEIFDIQEDIAEQVAGAISKQIDDALLARARTKPVTSLAAYDYWLQGMELLRQGSTESDQGARKLFERALAVDPHYSRAYTGISLSYFNDWSCQVTDQWDDIGSNAYAFAMKAVSIDDNDHLAQLVIGRILMFRKEFDLAEQHLDKSILLNPCDADNLIKQASCKAFLGKPEEGEALFLKALRLNPFRNLWYFTHGAITYFVQKKFEQCIRTALKGPLTEEWIDLPVFIAASYAHLGDAGNASRYLDIFIRAYYEKIAKDDTPTTGEIISWCRLANPFRFKAHSDLYIDGLKLAGLSSGGSETPAAVPEREHRPSNVFRQEGELWVMAFDGRTARLPGVKGYGDISGLLARPGDAVHCAELMGTVDSFADQEPVLDEKAKSAYASRIRDLESEISTSERNNDLVRSQMLKAELEDLSGHLARSLGIFNRPRTLNPETERARSAVTWRIRSAIKKIKTVHPSLSRHLETSIKTGTFCSYAPEKHRSWHL